MNGPEHYREAERLVALVDKIGPILSFSGPVSMADAHDIRDQFEAITDGVKATILTGGVEVHTTSILASAQVHATLALAAATAAQQATSYDGDQLAHRSRGWAGVA